MRARCYSQDRVPGGSARVLTLRSETETVATDADPDEVGNVAVCLLVPVRPDVAYRALVRLWPPLLALMPLLTRTFFGS